MDNSIGDSGPGIHRLTLRRDLDELQRMTAWVDGIAERAQMADSLVFGLQLCLEEAISNVIRHGAGPSEIVVSLEESPVALVASIEDGGPAFDPTLQPPPAPVTSIETATPGGLGIQLMRQFTKSIDYRRDGARNRLTLTFDRPAAQDT